MRANRVEMISFITETMNRAEVGSFAWRYCRAQQSALVWGGLLL